MCQAIGIPAGRRLSSERCNIKDEPGANHHIMDGFESAVTGSSADLIAQLAPPTRDALLRELFPAGIGGIGMSCLRISIGASDLSSATLRKSAPAAALLVAPGAHRRGCARRRVQQGPRSHMADIMTRGIARFQSAELDVCQ